MNKEILERMGQLIDTIDNFLSNKDNRFMPQDMKIDSYEHGMEEIKGRMMSIYLDCGGKDEWENTP